MRLGGRSAIFECDSKSAEQLDPKIRQGASFPRRPYSRRGRNARRASCAPARTAPTGNRANLVALALLAQLVEHLHGKEGVNGSSPLEGFSEAPAQQEVSLSSRETFRSGGVHETSTAPNVSELPVLQPLSPSGFAGSAAAST
jgi:hypothetical protein